MLCIDKILDSTPISLCSPQQTKPHNKKIQSLDRQISIQQIRHVHPKTFFIFYFFVVFFSLLVYRREEIVKWSRNVSKFCFYKEEEEEGRVLFLRFDCLIV